MSDEGMTRVRSESGRQMLVHCPGCNQTVGLWLRILEAPEAKAHRERTGWTDVTASILPPEQREAAMKQAAEMDAKAMVLPWVSCGFCGHDDHYVIGSSPSYIAPADRQVRS